MRPPGGGDQRWYSPERDLAYALPRYFRQAIFVRFGGEDARTKRDYGPYNFDLEGVTEEQFGEACVKVRELFLAMRDCQFPDMEVFRERLNELDEKVLGPLLWPMFLIMLTEYREWCALVSPKDETDTAIDMKRMERVVNDFVRTITKRKNPLYRFIQDLAWMARRALSRGKKDNEATFD